MKKVILLLILFVLTFEIVHSQTPNTPIPITVGPAPTYINGYFSFSYNDYRLIVTTLGIDANFNGVEDSGDVKPALYSVSVNDIMEGNFNGALLKELDFGSIPFPTRIYIDNNGFFAYLPNKLFIDRIQLESGALITHISPFSNSNLPEDAYIASVNYFNGYLFVSVRGTNINNFYIIDESKSEIVFETATEPNPQQSLLVGNYLFILCEGNFGQNDSKLMVYNVNLETREIVFVKTIELGNTGNHLALSGNGKLIVTMNGSHQIHIIDVGNLSIEKTIQLPTTGFDGPRESAVIGENSIVTTAFDGNLYIYDFDGNQTGKIKVGEKLEGLFAYVFPNPNMNLIIVAATSPFKQDYSANDKVYLFVNFSDVKEANSSTEPKIYPNPVKDFAKLSINNSFDTPITIQIIDNLGQIVGEYKFNLAGQEVLIPVIGQPSGIYTARVISKSRIEQIPFVVAR